MTNKEAINKKIKQIRKEREKFINLTNMPEDLKRANSFLRKTDEYIILEALKSYLIEEQIDNGLYIQRKQEEKNNDRTAK